MRRQKYLSALLALALCLSLSVPALAASPFTDVAETSPYRDAIAWAVDQSITKGTTATTFSPNNTCTTSHILTFLWRAGGRPGDEGDERAAVAAWAQGLDIDTSDLTAPCTRASAVTYMWKAAGSPAPAASASFTDVAADAPYAQAVSWAVEQGITNGATATEFAPERTCTRGQIATFLYRERGEAAPAAPETPAADGQLTLADLEGVWHLTKNGDGSPVMDQIDIEISGSQYKTYEIMSVDNEDVYYHRNCTVTGFTRGADGSYTLTRTGSREAAIPDGAYQKTDSNDSFMIKEVNLQENYFLNSYGDRFERVSSSSAKAKVLAVMEGARGKDVTQAALTGALWAGDNEDEDGVLYRECYKFESGGKYSCAYLIYANRGGSGADLTGYESGTYTLSGNTLTLKRQEHVVDDRSGSLSSDPEAVKTLTYTVRLAGNGVLWLNDWAYGNPAEAQEMYDTIKGAFDIMREEAQKPQTLDGYWTGSYTINGSEYTDIFYFNGSNYVEGTMVEGADGRLGMIYEEGTYRLENGRIYFSTTQVRGWMEGRSFQLDQKTYDWTLTQDGSLMTMNTHTYAHISDPAQARKLLSDTKRLTGAR